MEKNTLDYASPPAKPKAISRIAAASVILPMLLRLVYGLCRFDPASYQFFVHGWSHRATMLLNLLIYCGPFLLFAVAALWSICAYAPPLSPKSRLVGFVGLVVNVAILAQFGDTTYQIHSGYL